MRSSRLLMVIGIGVVLVLALGGLMLKSDSPLPLATTGTPISPLPSPAPTSGVHVHNTCSSVPELELKGRKTFWSESEESVCTQLFLRGKEMGWVTGLHCFDSKVITYFCSETPGADMEVPEGAVYGSSDSGVSIIDAPSGKISQPTLEDFSMFSNPSFCQRHIAYWGLKTADSQGRDNYYPSTVVASIYDLSTEKKLSTKIVGIEEVRTDNTAYFNAPRWDPSCQKATFTTSIQKKEVSVTLSASETSSK